MNTSSKKPPYFWLRLLLSLLFFCGGIFLVFWIQGFRFSEGELVETGVLSASTVDSGATLFVDSLFVNKTPALVLGEFVGEKNVCLFQNQKTPFCLTVFLEARHAELFENILLLPRFFRSRVVGSEEEIILDPLGRGFWRIFPETQSAAAFDGKSWHVFSHLRADEAIADFSGKASLAPSRPVIFSESLAVSRLAPKNRGILFFSEKQLFFRHFQKAETTSITLFSEPISDAFFFPDSDSFFVFLPSAVYFAHRFDAPLQKILDIEKNSAKFFPESRQILYFYSGFWRILKI